MYNTNLHCGIHFSCLVFESTSLCNKKYYPPDLSSRKLIPRDLSSLIFHDVGVCMRGGGSTNQNGLLHLTKRVQARFCWHREAELWQWWKIWASKLLFGPRRRGAEPRPQSPHPPLSSPDPHLAGKVYTTPISFQLMRVVSPHPFKLTRCAFFRVISWQMYSVENVGWEVLLLFWSLKLEDLSGKTCPKQENQLLVSAIWITKQKDRRFDDGGEIIYLNTCI